MTFRNFVNATVIASSAVLLNGVVVGQSQATMLTLIDFEGASFVTSPPSLPPCPTINQYRDCKWLSNPYDHAVHRVPLQAPANVGTEVNAWISTTISYNGSKSFGARLYDVPVTNEKHRVELELSNANVHPQVMGNDRYYGFAVYIHPQSQNTIIKPTKFFQAWQIHDVSSAKEPPITLDFIDNYRWRVKTSNDASQDNVIFSSSLGLQKAVWHEFVVRFKPSYTNNGAVTVWHNGIQKVSQTHQRNFGYQPVSTSPVVANGFQVRVGAYRGRDMSGTSLGQTILMFDELKIGTTYSSAAP